MTQQTIITTPHNSGLGDPAFTAFEKANANFTELYGRTATAVPYTPPGTGAVATTVAAKLNQIVSTADFGAAANGVTDDTLALQRFFTYVTTTGATGYLIPGTYLISSPLVITIGTTGFQIAGPSSSSCIFAVAATFSGGTIAVQLKGSGNPIGFRLGGFSVQPNGSITPGTCTTGLQVGDPATASIRVLGYQFSSIFDVNVTNFTTLWQITHARMIRFIDCSGWDLLGTVTTALSITQNGSFTGDLLFDKCQFVVTPLITTTGTSGTGATATITFAAQAFTIPAGTTIVVAGVTPAGYNGTYTVTASSPTSVSYSSATTGAQTVAGAIAVSSVCISVNSPVGPYNSVTGANSISGIKFRSCDLYSGNQVISVSATAQSYISDFWFIDGCQIDQQCITNIAVTSNNAGTLIEDFHIDGMYMNKSFTSGISFASTGTLGVIKSVWIEDCNIINAQANAISFFGSGCQFLHVNNNVVIDCNAGAGRAIEFNGATSIECMGNRGRTGTLNQKPQWFIGFDSGCTDVLAVGNDAIGTTLSGATIIDQTGAIANKTISNNPGYNPIAQTTIAVTASPFTFTNNTGSPVLVTISGGTVSTVALAGSGTIATATNTSLMVPQGQSATITYTVAPTMNYYGM